MVEFPSTIERTVASSLLLLSYGPVFFSPTRSESVEESSYVSKWCDEGSSNLSLRLGSNGSGSRSCGSDLSSDGSFGKSNDHGFKINYTGDPFHLVNFKTVRKRRSQVIWGSFNVKPTHLMMNSACDLSACSIDSKDESSCLSTGSSEVSSVESRIKLINQKSNEAKSRRRRKRRRKKVAGLVLFAVEQKLSWSFFLQSLLLKFGFVRFSAIAPIPAKLSECC